jgi:hypothetical protein
MSSDRNIHYAKQVAASNDKGPYKLAEFEADGKRFYAEIVEPYGVQSSAPAGSRALILYPDGDPGKAVAIVMPPPGQRVDGQKEGEAGLHNHVTGNTMVHDKDGNTVITTKDGSIVKLHRSGAVGVLPKAGQKVFLGSLDEAGCGYVATSLGYSRNVMAKV